jgi:integrase
VIREDKKTGRFQVYGRRDGKQVYVTTCDSKKEAQSAERRHMVLMEQIVAGEVPAEVDLHRTLKAAAEDWLESLKANGSRSHTAYTNSMRIYIWPALENVPVAKLTKAQVMTLRDDLARHKSAATVNGAITCLSSAFSDFVDRGWVPVNPVRGVKRVRAGESVYTWISSREDITKLLVECPRGIRELAAWALGTGLRISELTSLRWADIDLERRLIAVHRGRQGTTKSGKVRHVPILNALLSLMREMALQRDGAELVFPGEPDKDGSRRPRSLVGVRVPFKQAAKRAGLSTALRFHDLRHTFASHWVLDGGDIFRLSKILGHSSVVITQKTYAHLAPEAWSQDYHRVAFTLPSEDAAYGITKRKKIADLKHEIHASRVFPLQAI